MDFLADECCPKSIVVALRRAGHDVIHVQDDRDGADDVESAAIACRWDRVLITEDYDFGELVVRHEVRLPGLVMLALFAQSREARVQRVLEVVDRLGEALRGHITVVEPGRERVRPMRTD